MSSRLPESIASGTSTSNPKRTSPTTLDDEALMMFEENLRAQLPGISEIVGRAEARKRRKKAAVTTLGMLVIGALLWADPVYHTENIATRIGERSVWEMHDGSQIALNTDSSLRIAHHLRSRQVYLERGEALFTVSHSRLRSFVVHAYHTRVVDIGTVFNVRNTENGADVTVVEGSVQVFPESTTQNGPILRAGETIRVDQAGLQAIHATDTELATGWRHGKLYFDRTPLRQLAAELNRYRHHPVMVASAIGDVRISGQFDIDNLEQLLTMLPTLAPVRIEHRTDGSVAISSRTDK
ncbi:FecR domain-containing protein [uncultured Oxalicibacterium sp.]|uniref:FecR family protein n=1 Tax=uncultured Oxalicibacterium sp. TaxID=1168540 RepID=UPI0025D95182|nr:FecR domain-containing protein [uncultured Oxalicibacterium sp.]